MSNYFAELSKDEQLREEALTRLMNEVTYRLDRDGLIEEGIEKGRKSVALNMLKEGSELSFVSKVTGLSEDEIRKLKK